MKTWIFQGNPQRFNVNDYLQDNDEIWWSIRQKHIINFNMLFPIGLKMKSVKRRDLARYIFRVI